MLRQRQEHWKRLLEQAEAWARELAEVLGKRGIRVSEILLFGSIARGDYREESDIDLIIVSDDWKDVEYLERLSILYRLWSKPIDATFLPLTPEELKERVARSVVLRDASKYWVRIYKAT